MTQFNSAAIKAHIAETITAKPGESYVVFTHDARVQLDKINTAMQEKFGRDESELTDNQKHAINLMLELYTAYAVTGEAVDGVVYPVGEAKFNRIIQQIQNVPEAAAVEIAFFTKLVTEVVDATERFKPSK